MCDACLFCLYSAYRLSLCYRVTLSTFLPSVLSFRLPANTKRYIDIKRYMDDRCRMLTISATRLLFMH